MADFELMDALCVGSVSRRQFMEKIAAAGAGASLLAASAFGQQKPQPDAENPKYSPENIGGGGRLERNFYRDWIRKSKVPMVEGYSIYDARDQEEDEPDRRRDDALRPVEPARLVRYPTDSVRTRAASPRSHP